jgi:peptidyl-prolyl cis-trans isomerase C
MPDKRNPLLHLSVCPLAVILCGLALHSPAARGQAAGAGPPAAATVNDEPIYVSEIVRLLIAENKMRSASSPVPAADFAAVLNQLIMRRAVVQRMKREGGYFADEEVDKKIAELKARVAASKVPFEAELARQGVTADTLRNEMIWQVAWPRCLDRNLTDKLQAYFNAHRKEFDGTEVQASHILLRAESAGENYQQVVELAKRIREGIESGKVTWDQAAQKFSVAPSRASGGDVGYFPRNGVMHENFAKAAFELEPGKISEPVTTPFGIHLIRAGDSKPGTKQWTEVLDQLRAPASVELFEQLAKDEATKAKVVFSPSVPHLDPETGRLITPAAPPK